MQELYFFTIGFLTNGYALMGYFFIVFFIIPILFYVSKKML